MDGFSQKENSETLHTPEMEISSTNRLGVNYILK